MTLLPKLQHFLPELKYKDIVKYDTISLMEQNFNFSEFAKVDDWPVVTTNEGPAYYVQQQYYSSFSAGSNNNVALTIHIRDCDEKILATVYEFMLESYSTFRTFFHKKSGTLTQVVVPNSSCFRSFIGDASHEILRSEQGFPFDLRYKRNKKHLPLLRFCLSTNSLQIVSHHIAVDTVGLVLLERKILETYQSCLQHEKFLCAKEKHTPLEFGIFETGLPDLSEYWRGMNQKALESGWVPATEWRYGTQPADDALIFERQLQVDAGKLKELARLKSTTLYTICLFAFDGAMRKIAEDPHKNIPIAFLFNNRWRAETQEMMACLIQTSLFLTEPNFTLENFDLHVNETFENSKRAPWPYLTNDFDVPLLFSSEDGFDYQTEVETAGDADKSLTKTNRSLCCFVSGLNSDSICIKLKYDVGIFSEVNIIAIMKVIECALQELQKIF
jgi:hypothetical protein